MNLELSGRVAVVTGAASGIGLGTVRQLVQEGCAVACWDYAPQLADVVASLNTEFPDTRLLAVRCDIADFAGLQAAAAQTESELGAIEILVHAAAIGSGKFGFPFTNLTPSDWPRVLEVNIQGTTNVAHAVIPRMPTQQASAVVLVASVAGQIGSQTDPPYSASKAANINFAQCLAKDLAPQGIRVNTVCPGMVQTPLNEAVWKAWHDQQPPEQQRSYADWAGDKVRAVVPLQCWQQTSDIADMIVFLASARAGQVTGQTINVDGGFVMHW